MKLEDFDIVNVRQIYTVKYKGNEYFTKNRGITWLEMIDYGLVSHPKEEYVGDELNKILEEMFNKVIYSNEWKSTH